MRGDLLGARDGRRRSKERAHDENTVEERLSLTQQRRDRREVRSTEYGVGMREKQGLGSAVGRLVDDGGRDSEWMGTAQEWRWRPDKAIGR